MDLQYIFTSLDGRINRAKWWAGFAIVALVSLILSWLIETVFGQGFFGGFLGTLITLALFFPLYAVCAKRFQDRAKPGTIALYGLIPFLLTGLFDSWGLTGTPGALNALAWLCTLVNLGVLLWFLIDLGILKGTPGPNTYGGDPLSAIR